ncbi:hypothetical protein EDD18DRAFT_1356306 [Armillaria luteobubalina]|uniref:Uncharacterized protein n=1 Tax=Armillaria luteobubalina TaxID=153913 RepID=A0AA39Q229_9AGAR|nr:hypothetical protein EDD18DRAFT_1356306 [Armillaria luteobubalina]
MLEKSDTNSQNGYCDMWPTITPGVHFVHEESLMLENNDTNSQTDWCEMWPKITLGGFSTVK